jgi:hypothetical protein
MAICLHGEQRSECVAFRPRVDLTAGIPSRDAAANTVRAFEAVPGESRLASHRPSPERRGSALLRGLSRLARSAGPRWRVDLGYLWAN